MQRLSKGDIIILDDSQTIRDMIQTGGSIKGKRATVVDVERIETEVSTWSLYTLDYEDLVLVVQDVGGIQELCIYFEVEEFESGNRLDILDSAPWIFADFNEHALDSVLELEYNPAINAPDGSTFYQKMPTMFGEDQDGRLASVVEWSTTADIENPHLMVTEVGDGDDGGLIRLYQGVEIQANDIEVMKG